MVATFWVSSSLYLLAQPARAESGVVSATGSGHDAPEAIVNLLRTTIGKYFRNDPKPQAALTRTILQTEIVPNASSFVQSYKIVDSGKPGTVSLSANLDLDVIRGLVSLTPKNLGEADGASALVLTRGPKLPESVVAGLKNQVIDPFSSLGEAARERFLRREFRQAELTPEQIQEAGVGEDYANPETLRGLGNKAGARVALGVVGHFETFENENSHNKDERLVLTGTMVDAKTGAVLAKAAVNVVNPKTRRDQYLADLQRNVQEESKDLFQDLFVAAGRRMVKSDSHNADFSVVRVLYPPNAAVVARFKQLLEGVSGVRSVIDYSVRRGKYDFAIRPVIAEDTLAKSIASIQATDLTVLPLENAPTELEAHAPAVTVRLAPKEAAAPTEGGANAIPSNVPGPRR